MSAATISAPVMRVDDLHMQFKRRRSMTERLSGQPARIVHALNGEIEAASPPGRRSRPGCRQDDHRHR